MIKVVATGAMVLVVGLVACATGSTAPEDPLELATDAGAAPLVLDSGTTVTPGVDAAGSSSPGNVAIGTTGGGADSGASPPPTGGDDAGFAFDAGGFDAGDFDAGFGFDAGELDAGPIAEDAGGTGVTCQGYADPNTVAGCTCAATNPSDCQANGCYGGYWCKLSTKGCHATPPSGC